MKSISSVYIQADNRKQQMFFPPSIDEYVSSDNPVRVIDDYVEMLDMKELGFKLNKNELDGAPSYHPKLLLKIYIYGYLNRIRSSRKLECEIKRNIELIWLCSNLKPSYKTIANFRKDNPKALKRVFREFTLLCKNIDLISGDVVAVDGAFLRANASKNQLITKKTLQKDIKQIDERIEEYIKDLDFIDAKEKKIKNLSLPPVSALKELKAKKAKLDEDLKLLEELNEEQFNKTDPDAKLMVKPAHNLMAYNSQIAVDSKWKFIVATDVSSTNDSDKLHHMAVKTKEITQKENMIIEADTGYYSFKEIKKCIKDKIEPIVPAPNRGKVQENRGKFPKEKFIYDKEKDIYICPNDKELTKASFTQKKNGMIYFVYRGSTSICKDCPLREKCLPSKTAYKTLYRWEEQEIIDKHTEKMKTKEAKKLIKQRSSLAEHPFGTIKRVLGWDHFLVRGIEKVSGENALIMFTYNFKRLLNLIGITLFRELIKAIKIGNIEDIKPKIVKVLA